MMNAPSATPDAETPSREYKRPAALLLFLLFNWHRGTAEN